MSTGRRQINPKDITLETTELEVADSAITQWEGVLEHIKKSGDGIPLQTAWRSAKHIYAGDWRHSCSFCEYASLRTDNGERSLRCLRDCVGVKYKLFPAAPYGCGQENSIYLQLEAETSDKNILQILEIYIQELKALKTRIERVEVEA